MSTRALRAILGAGILIGVMMWLSAASAATRAAAAPPSSLRELPFTVQTAIAGVLGRDDEAYAIVATPNGYRADNPTHDLTAEFSAEGVRIRHGDETWTLQLLSVGDGDAENPVAPIAPWASANRVEYARGALTEWYVNGPLGLEQGFTLDRAPGREHPGGLTLTLALAGKLQARVEESGRAVELERVGGSTALRHAGLSVQDATEQSLLAWMEFVPSAQENGREALLLHVDDRGAAYPLLIDRFLRRRNSLHPMATRLTGSAGALRSVEMGISSWSVRHIALSATTRNKVRRTCLTTYMPLFSR